MNHTAEGEAGPPARLSAAIDHAAHLLPAQGPIAVFIHHTTLHAFEHLPFDEAVTKAGTVFGCEPYLSEARYHRERAAGRITDDDLRAVLADDLGDTAREKVGGVTRWDLRFAMLTHPPSDGTADEVRWQIAADEIPTRHSVLWRQCVDAVEAVPADVPPAPFARPRDRILAAGGLDTDSCVNELLGRYTAAFLDQGVSHRPQPNKGSGFFRGFCELYAGGWHATALADNPRTRREKESFEETLERLVANRQVLWQYCDAQGALTDAANPNGSLQNIAGLCNERRNVAGLMPHPDRASEEILGSADGRLIFESMIHALHGSPAAQVA